MLYHTMTQIFLIFYIFGLLAFVIKMLVHYQSKHEHVEKVIKESDERLNDIREAARKRRDSIELYKRSKQFKSE